MKVSILRAVAIAGFGFSVAMASLQTQAATVAVLDTGAANYGLTGPGPTSTTAAVINPNPAWVDDSAIAGSWIGVPGTNAANSSNPAGEYTFTTTFTLSEAQLSSATLTGSIAADNSAVIKLNGVDTGATSSGFGALTSWSAITSGFVVGANTLEVVVTNLTGSGTNPMGLLLSDTTVSAVPLPAAAWLFGSALLGLVTVARRRAKAAG